MTTLNKTTKAFKGGKDLPLITIAAVAFVLAAPLYDRVKESRSFRDFYNLTPFTDVEVTSKSVVESEVGDVSAIVVSGTMRKVRCTRDSIVVYTSHQVGPLVPAKFVPLESPATPLDRPPSTEMQVFGPWKIVSEIVAPSYAFMFVTHKCDGEYQTNRFFKIAWEDLQPE